MKNAIIWGAGSVGKRVYTSLTMDFGFLGELGKKILKSPIGHLSSIALFKC